MRYDATLKRVFHRLPHRLISSALGREVRLKRVLPTELITVQNAHPDLLFETEDGEVIHAELHGYGMQDFGVRNLGYFWVLLRDYGKPPIQIVFWIGQGKPGVSDGLSFPPALEYRYRVIDVREIDAEYLLEGGAIEESIFAILCKLGDARQVIARILARIGQMPVEEQREAVLLLLVLSGLRDLQPLVKDEVKRMPVAGFDIHENGFLEEIYQEGLEQGIEKGVERTERSILIDLAEQKFGPLSTHLKQRVESAPAADLQRWTRRILQSSTVDEIFQ